ncbi:hypothetical protein Q9L58_006560 [Maublancomyces gigas]|uniref:HNH nuclease domain-containing protein n=1 Tax=Discina gigas TaxID=1032678 RepID=A0ABR3GG63_9PEZI
MTSRLNGKTGNTPLLPTIPSPPPITITTTSTSRNALRAAADFFPLVKMSYTPPATRTRSHTPSILTKDRIRRLTGQRCWLCHVTGGKNIAHLLDRSDPALLDLYVRDGLLETTNINSEANVFLPCPLEPFLRAKQDFQAARRDNPRAKRTRFSRGHLFQPYLIREGHINFAKGNIGDPRRWHGDPMIAILRSYALLHGLQRVSVDNGGAPPEVAAMYVTLIGLYGTAAPDPAILDTITLQPVVSPDEKLSATRAGKRPAETRDLSDVESVATSPTAAEGRGLWALFKLPLKRSRRLEEAGSVSEAASEAPSDQTGYSHDTQLTSAVVPSERVAKRARFSEDLSHDGVVRWDDATPGKWSPGMDI